MKIKRILSIGIVFIFVCSNIFAKAEDILPSYYNSNEGKYADRLPPVRNQGAFPDCWAYAALGALEYTAVFKDYKNYSDSNMLYSEHHMAAAMNETQDEDYSKYTREGTDEGTRDMAVGYMSRSVASGPVLFSEFDRDDYLTYRKDRSDFTLLFGKKRETTLTKAHYITNVYEGSSVLSYSGTAANPGDIQFYKNTEIINKIKTAVIEYGAVAVNYYSYASMTDKYYNPDTGAYCILWEDMLSGDTPDGNKVTFKPGKSYSFTEVSNHIVTIVGWDDNYSYKNFESTPVSCDGESYTPENGAWIIRNSWGDDWGNNGYGYISYMDPTIGFGATVYESEDMAENQIYSYAYSGANGSSSFICKALYGLNRYETEGEEVLTSIGIHCADSANAVEIAIDTNPGDTPVVFTDSGFLSKRAELIDIETGKEFVRVEFDNPGYYVYELKTPLKVNGKFDVYIRYLKGDSGKIIVASGGSYKDSGTSYGSRAVYIARSDTSGNIDSWSGYSGAFIANAYTTKQPFEVPEITKSTDNVNVTFKAYGENRDVRAFVALYDGEYVVKTVTSENGFDENGKLELDIDVSKLAVTGARAFIWNRNVLEPIGTYNKVEF